MEKPENILNEDQIQEILSSLPDKGPFGKEYIRNPEGTVIVSGSVTSGDLAKNAERHEHHTDIFLVKEGKEELFIGGKIIDEKEKESGEWRGGILDGARKYNIKAGDVIIIPKNIPHRHGGNGIIKMIVIKIK